MSSIDHIAQAEELLLSQFEGSVNIVGLLKSWLSPVQKLEDDLQAFMSSSGVSTATGVMLDIIGSWMGVVRGSKTDDQYRQAILAEASLELANPSTTSFYQSMKAVTGSDAVNFLENYPPTLYAHLGAGWDHTTYDQLKRVTRAGINLVVMIDYDHDSFYMSDVVSVDNAIIDHTGEEYILRTDGLDDIWISSDSDGAVDDGMGTIMSDTVDPEGSGTAMADVLTKTYTIVDGFIVDQDGNRMVNDQGDYFTYRDIV